MASQPSIFTTDFNLGIACDVEPRLLGSARPGAKQRRCYSTDLRVTPEEVAEWVAAVKAAGAQRVVSMLSDSELATYAEPLAAALTAAFGEGKWINVDGKASGTAPTVIAALRAARDAGETALVYCWGGGGRTGVVQAAWLVLEHGMSEADAAAAVVGHATGSGLSRRVDAAALSDFVAEARTAAA